MHKIQKTLISLLAFSAIVAPFSRAWANDGSDYYLTVGGGLLFGNKPGTATNTIAGGLGATDTFAISFKKPKTGGEFLAGVGYNVMDNFRLEAVFIKPWFGKSNISGTRTHTISGSSAVIVPLTGKMTAQINSLQLRGYFDVFEISDMGKAYVGAGLGWAQVKSKGSITIADVTTSGSSKNKNNLAWFLGVGAFFNVSDGVKLAVEYNYQDFGKMKKISDSTYGNKKSFAGHALLAKIMFDI